MPWTLVRNDLGSHRHDGRPAYLRLRAVLLVQGHDALHVPFRFSIGRDAAVLGHGLLAGIVGRKGQRQVAVVYVHEIAQVLDAAFDVGLGLEAVLHLQGRGGLRHELHESLGTLGGDGLVIEVGLGLDDGLDEGVVDLVLAGGLLDQGPVLRGVEACLDDHPPLLDPELVVGAGGQVGDVHDPVFVRVAVDVGMGRHSRKQDAKRQHPEQQGNQKGSYKGVHVGHRRGNELHTGDSSIKIMGLEKVESFPAPHA